MEKSLFTCPICAAPLERGERAYACPNGHAYDKAREGYVHLLPANKKHSKAPGDDKGMAEARRRLGQARAVLVSRSIQQAPFELKSYVRDYGLSVSHLCVILTPESRKNLNVTPALEDSLLARVREAAALYSPETQLLLNPAEETLRGIFAEADVVVGTGDFTLEGMGAPLIPAVNETTSLSFPSYVRTVRRMCRRLEHGTERSSLLLGKMPFQSRHYPLYCNQSNLAAKEMWSRMWLNRKGDSV